LFCPYYSKNKKFVKRKKSLTKPTTPTTTSPPILLPFVYVQHPVPGDMPGLQPKIVEIALTPHVPLKTVRPFENPAYALFSKSIKD